MSVNIKLTSVELEKEFKRIQDEFKCMTFRMLAADSWEEKSRFSYELKLLSSDLETISDELLGRYHRDTDWDTISERLDYAH